ncbi:MAG: cob(I)yrinic acid a,c-diamide adenosyltransferase [Bacteroidetes bacterium]|nr:cob(I)yrinic acid a,c-diamide adenosyltransferase [Bacteroidota bacterium]
MKIYTKTGDQGKTALFGGRRVGKDSARIEAYGTVDELNAFLGFALVSAPEQIAPYIIAMQNELFVVGADLATPLDTKNTAAARVTASHIALMEERIDAIEAQLEPIQFFILPGGSETAARLHLCRTVARRAERLIVHLSTLEEINEHDLRYINRLSDFLFVLARYANHVAGRGDVRWQQE